MSFCQENETFGNSSQILQKRNAFSSSTRIIQLDKSKSNKKNNELLASSKTQNL